MNKIERMSVRYERSQCERNPVISKNSEDMAKRRQAWIA